jgi:hypothetical protein
MRQINWAPINNVVSDLRREAQEEIVRTTKRVLDAVEGRIRMVELNRQAVALLDAAGFDFQISNWNRGSHVSLDLGFFPHSASGNRKLAEKIRLIHQTLGCKTTAEGKDVADGEKKRVEFVRKPVLFPGLTIKWQRRLRSTDKCKIVRSRSTYRSLVCQA